MCVFVVVCACGCVYIIYGALAWSLSKLAAVATCALSFLAFLGWRPLPQCCVACAAVAGVAAVAARAAIAIAVAIRFADVLSTLVLKDGLDVRMIGELLCPKNAIGNAFLCDTEINILSALLAVPTSSQLCFHLIVYICYCICNAL